MSSRMELGREKQKFIQPSHLVGKFLVSREINRVYSKVKWY